MSGVVVRPPFREQLIWALATLITGTTVVAVTWGAGSPKLSPGDPGPWGLPMACGILIVICALAELMCQWILLTSTTTSAPDAAETIAQPSVTRIPDTARCESERPDLRDQDETEPDTARLTLGDWLTIGAIGLYCLAMPWLGFTISTVLLTPLLLARFGAGWSIFWSLLIGLAMVIFIKLIFGSVFGVQLPEGVLGF
jgi:hypothetical protein